MAASPFRPALELMVQYAQYHRDRRNIATHFVGIPLIVFAIGILLARAQFEIGGLHTSAAWLLWAPGYARTASQVSGTPPEQRWVLRSDSGDPVRLGIESALGATLLVVPSLSVRNEF